MKQVLEREKVCLSVQSSSRPLNVLLMGPSMDQKGGMATVQILICQEAVNKAGTMPAAIRHICTHDEGSALHRLNVFAIALVKYLRLLLTCRLDVIHMHVSERGSVWRKLLLMLIAKPFSPKVIFHTHGCEFHSFHENLSAFGKAVVNLLLQQVDGYIMLSQSWKHYYVNACGLAPAKVVVLPNPAEVPATVPDRTGSPVVQFAFLGRVGQRKGAFDLIRAFAALPSESRAFSKLLLAGDGEVRAARLLAAELGVAEHVQCLGWIGPAERNQLLRQASVFVLPSYNEGLPMAMLEAMAWALPIISTSVGGIPEFLDHRETGYLIRPGDISALTRAMQQLIESESLRQKMGERARSRVKPLDIQLYYDQLIDIYRALIDEPAALPVPN